MEKLELKHLAPYLPYGLKAEILDYKCDYVNKRYDEIVGVHQWDKTCLYWSVLTVGGSKPNIERIKPMLRPLSDLTKEIEHGGEKFVPTKALSMWDLEGITAIDIPHIPVNLYELLLKWHFDIFGLIEKGLAVDINTLSE